MKIRVFFYLFLISANLVIAQEKPLSEPIILPGSNADLNAVAVSPAKINRMAVAGWNNEILIYKADSTLQLVQKIGGHTAAINYITWNLSGNKMASASGDMSIKIYDSLYRNIPIQEDPAIRHLTAVQCLTFDRSGNFLFSGDREGRLMLWDVNLKKPIKYYLTGNTINDMCLSPQNQNIFVAHADKQIKLIALAGGKIVRTLDGHKDAVNCLAISPNSRFLISGANDKTAIIWDLKTWKSIAVLNTDSWKVTAVAFTEDNKYCATGTNDGKIIVWETETGKQVSSQQYPDMNIRDLAFTKDHSQILLAPKMKQAEKFGARLVPSLIPVPVKPVVIKTSPMQQSLDSIMAIRPLNKQDSVKYKSILTPPPAKKNNTPTPPDGKNGNKTKPLDSAIIYKTPMNQAPKK